MMEVITILNKIGLPIYDKGKAFTMVINLDKQEIYESIF